MKVHSSTGESAVTSISHIAGQVQGCCGDLGLVIALAGGHWILMKVTSGCVHTYKCIKIVQGLIIRQCKHRYIHTYIFKSKDAQSSE